MRSFQRPPQPIRFPSSQCFLREGRYRYEEAPVGQGSYGRVYHGHDTLLQRVVAIKASAHYPGSDKHMLNEAKQLVSLKHPGLPTYLDLFQEKTVWYLVQQWCPGIPLANAILEMPEVLSVGIRCCEILEAIHREGVVHRDLKPEHVLIQGSQVMLIDFGIACFLDAAWPAGSFAYSAPEQWEQGETSAKVDVYSLGMSLGTVLTGCELHQGTRPGSLQQCWNQASLPNALLTLLCQMTRHDPMCRPSVPEVAEQLRWIRG